MTHRIGGIDRRHTAIGALFVLTLLFSACVTTTTPVFKEPSESEEINRRVEAASAYLSEGKTELAILHLRKALELDDNSPAVHDTLARVFVGTGEFELAESHYRKAIASDGSFSRARNNYATLLYRLERYPEAYDQLETVVADTLYERRPRAFVNLGRCALKLDKLERAEEAFTRALMMDERYYPAALELATINYERRDYALAKRYYDSFRNRSPRQSPRSLVLGIRLGQVFDDDDAIASYSLALKNLYPDSQEYLEYRNSKTD